MSASGGVIVGDWTHRRGDPGGTRALSADVLRAKPHLAWRFSPERGGVVEQVRIVGDYVYCVAMEPSEAHEPGWSHAVLFALDAKTGHVRARRTIPDPLPIDALAAGEGRLIVVALRPEDGLFVYELALETLAPISRRRIDVGEAALDDVLDIWTRPDGGAWLEVERASRRAYALIPAGTTRAIFRDHPRHHETKLPSASPSDACVAECDLYAPLPGHWTGEEGEAPFTWHVSESVGDDARSTGVECARAEVVGPGAREHVLAAEGGIASIAAMCSLTEPGKLDVQAIVVDRGSEVERMRTTVSNVVMRSELFEGARLCRRPNGELLFQPLDADGLPATDVVCIHPDAVTESIVLGTGHYVIDVALGDLVLSHSEKGDETIVAGFEIDREGRLLGRRSSMRWSLSVGALGGSTTVYAGAGHIIARGASAIVAVRV